MESIEGVKQVLGEALNLGDKAQSLDSSTKLFGSLPELDSMSIVTIVLLLEEHFGFTIDDDEIGADTFESVGTLAEFVELKLTQNA